MDCDIDQYWADEATDDVIFGYIARNSPGKCLEWLELVYECMKRVSFR